MILTFQGSLLNLNEYVNLCRKNKYDAAKAKKDIEEKLMWEILTQAKREKIIKCSIFNFKWYEENKKRDPDNICFAKKFILDAIVKSGLMQNDGWNEVKGFTDNFFIDKENQRIEVEIVEG